jgi:hypothetical protein
MTKNFNYIINFGLPLWCHNGMWHFTKVAAICTKSVTPFHCGCKNIVWTNFMTEKLKNNSFKLIHAKYYHRFNSTHDREKQFHVLTKRSIFVDSNKNGVQNYKSD